MELKYTEAIFGALEEGRYFYLNGEKYRKIQEVTSGEYEDDNGETFNCIAVETLELCFAEATEVISMNKSPDGMFLDMDEMIMLRGLLNAVEERKINEPEQDFLNKLTEFIRVK